MKIYDPNYPEATRQTSSLPPDIWAAGHPYKLSEDVPAEVLSVLYETPLGSVPSVYRHAMKHTELAISAHDPEELEKATVALQATIGAYPAGSSIAGRAELALALSPLALLRSKRAEPTLGIGIKIYKSLARLLDGEWLDRGSRYEAGLGALCTRLALSTGDMSYLPHLSPPRMEASELKAAGGRVFSNDLHLLGPTTVIQSKGVPSGVEKGYEAHMLKLRLLSIVGNSLHNTEGRSREPVRNDRRRENVRTVLQAIVLDARADPETDHALLDRAIADLRGQIDAHRAEYPMPADPASLIA